MEIKKVEIKLVDEKELQHIKPTLQIEVELEYKASQEMLLNIYGDIIVGKKILASIKINEIPDSELKPQIEVGKKFAPTTIKLNGYIELGKELVDLINKSRRSNLEGDVIFNVKLTASYLENKAVLSYVTELSTSILNQSTSKIIGGMGRDYVPDDRDISLLIYAIPDRSSSYNQNRTNLNLISTSGTGNGYIAHKSISKNCNITIPSSKWCYNYAPKLGIGNFLVLEIPFGQRTDEKEINKALKLISNAEKSYLNWDVAGVFTNCRTAIELLRNKIKRKFPNSDKYMKLHRLVDDIKFNNKMQRTGLYSFLSLAGHTDDDGVLNPEVNQCDAEVALYFTKILVKYMADMLMNRNVD